MLNKAEIDNILESDVEKYLRYNGDDKALVLNKLEELNQFSFYPEITKRKLHVLETVMKVSTAKELVELTPKDLFTRVGNNHTFARHITDTLLHVFGILMLRDPDKSEIPFREHSLDDSLGFPFYPWSDGSHRSLKYIVKAFLHFGKNPWVEIPEILANINTTQLFPPLPVYKDPDEPHPMLQNIVKTPDHTDHPDTDIFYLPRLDVSNITVDEHNNMFFGQLALYRDNTGIYAFRRELEEVLLSGTIDHTPLKIDFLPTLNEGYINLLVKWGLHYDGILLLKDLVESDEVNPQLSPAVEKIYETITLIQSAGDAKLLQHTNDPRGELVGKNFYRLPTLPGVTFRGQSYPTDTCEFYDEVNELSFSVFYPE